MTKYLIPSSETAESLPVPPQKPKHTKDPHYYLPFFSWMFTQWNFLREGNKGTKIGKKKKKTIITYGYNEVFCFFLIQKPRRIQ